MAQNNKHAHTHLPCYASTHSRSDKAYAENDVNNFNENFADSTQRNAHNNFGCKLTKYSGVRCACG